jgi:SulP family sulfate permease
MAAKITDIVGEDNPDAVIATTIVSFSVSAMMTGLVFYLMGRFKVGYMVGFIPRHILIGCIGGVGWFLIATGFEVSARLDGSLQYNLDTLKQLSDPATVPLWVVPLVLAIVLFYGQSKITSKFFLPLFILAIPLIFYFFVLALDSLDVDVLRDHGWIFEGPPSGEPWWYFYTLYSESNASSPVFTTRLTICFRVQTCTLGCSHRMCACYACIDILWHFACPDQRPCLSPKLRRGSC